MKKYFAILSFLVSISTYAKDKVLTAQETDSVWMVNNYTKQEVYIPMRDGKRLFTSIYAPKDASEKHPILMMRTPYSITPYGVDTFRAFWKTYYMDYCKEGYIMVLQDVRGKFMSEGEYMNIRPFNPDKKGKETDEASDAYDTIDWLIKNLSNNNGRVGVYGISYPGYYATMAALSGNKYLKAVSPQAPVTDWFSGDDIHHNGAFFLMDNFGFSSSFDKPRLSPTKSYARGYTYPTKDLYKFYLETATIDSLGKIIGEAKPYWDELSSHPDMDDYWKARNTRNFVQYIPDSCATLVVGGLFDAEDCFGALNLYKAIENKAHNDNRLIMGPWAHGFWAKDSGAYLGNIRFGRNTSVDYHKIEEEFFNKHLLTNGKYLWPKKETLHMEKQIFVTGENTWMAIADKDKADKRAIKYYLQSNGKLDTVSCSDNKNPDHYISDPTHPVPYIDGVITSRTREYMDDDQRFASQRPDVLSWQTGVLKEDVGGLGPVTADLFVSLSTSDADFIVKVIDVFPDDFSYPDSVKGNGKGYVMGGYEMLVRAEVMRGRYRNSLEKPEPFEPGVITEVKYKMPDIAHVFKKGHRIMVQVQSTWFPLMDRNPQQYVNIYKAKPEDFIKTKVTIYHDKEHPSHISFPELYFCAPPVK